MMRYIVLLVIVASAGVTQQIQRVNGSISGVLLGEDGTAIVGGTVILHLTPGTTPRIARQKTDWAAATVSGGTFQFAGLPEGKYTVCPRVPKSTWLNPCEWNFPTPIASISRSNPNPVITITLKRGVAVPIRIDDPGQLLAQHEGKTPGAGLFLNISGPGMFFRLVPLVSKDAVGRDYQIVVPFNTPLTVVVHPSFYQLKNAFGAALTQNVSTKIPLLVAAGQQVAPIKFSVSGADASGGRQ